MEELRSVRMEKLKKLQEAGVNAYPTHTARTHSVADVLAHFDAWAEGGAAPQQVTVAGRIMTLRPQGALTFLHLFDGTGQMQALLKSDEMDAAQFTLFDTTTDIGDFIELTGGLFTTKRGEKTVKVATWRMLSKSLRPLPEKWHGLQDIEERYRRRYLDLLMSPEERERFALRSRSVALIRRFYAEQGYMEVETPRLQVVAGGATAKPFVTHHNALDTDFYLTIAQELYLKMLLAGGYNKVFEIGRKFRNEGIDATHNPEFTMLESNEAYADAVSQRDFIERLFKFLIHELFGTDRPTIAGVEYDFAHPFAVTTFYDLIAAHTDIAAPAKATVKDLTAIATKLGVKVEPHDTRDTLLDAIYKRACRPKLVQPVFIIDYPVEMNPFAKRKENDPTLIDRFQLVAGGLELVNAFAELNNPIDQKERYLEQDKKRASGNEEISPSDRVYLEAMEYGMPPNGGIGIGIDRLAMFLTGAKNIKEVILFPTLKPDMEK